MKTVMCFGDSNTYGYIPGSGKRYEENVRWTGILKNKISRRGYNLVEEGLVGRTTVFEDSVRPGRKGIDLIIPLIESHAPVDTLVLMLGTNDCKTIYNTSPYIIGKGIERLVKTVNAYDKSINIVLVSPILLGDEVWKDEFDPEFNKHSVEVSKGLKAVYKNIADRYGCKFLAASDITSPSKRDQEHMEEAGHRALADSLEYFFAS